MARYIWTHVYVNNLIEEEGDEGEEAHAGRDGEG